jgi:ribosomal-protein-alanine N-acetyltransferase
MQMVRLWVASGQRRLQVFRSDHPISSYAAPPGYNVAVEISLRDFWEADFETLWRIDQACFAPGIAYSRRELMSYVRLSQSTTLVAEATSGAVKTPEIVGYVIAHTGPKSTGHIITIDVLPSAQRLGVGSKLLSGAETRLLDKKCTISYLETAVDNLPALVFYKRHNYFLLKTLPRYYSNGVDAFVLQKDLLSSAQAS